MSQIIKYDLRVLYVEDDDDLREELSSYIQRRVKEIKTASNGLDALNGFQSFKPDIVITDLKMPHMDGFQLSEEIRKIDKLIPIIVTTALSDVDSILDTVNLGIDKYLIKPIQIDELQKVLKTMADKIAEMKLLGAEKGSRTYDDEILLEKSIQGITARYIKKITGTGPKKVLVKINGNKLLIQILGSRLEYEKVLLINRDNHSMIDYLRASFYKQVSKGLLSEIREECIIDTSVVRIDTDSSLDIDSIELRITSD